MLINKLETQIEKLGTRQRKITEMEIKKLSLRGKLNMKNQKENKN